MGSVNEQGMGSDMNGQITLLNSVKLIGKLFRKAEESVKTEVDNTFNNAHEEQITNLLHSALAKKLNEANKQRVIERAFLQDLRNGIQKHSNYQLPSRADIHLSDISRGLIAKVSWHSKQEESITGGDFGMAIIQPELTFENLELSIKRCENKCGLLVQAKKRLYNGEWGQITVNQEKILNDRLSYLSLLRYEFIDPENKNLQDFFWTLCNGYGITDVIGWLTKNNFPETQTSEDIIMNLGLGRIGIRDKHIINSIIIPEKSKQTLIIKIDWEGKDPKYPLSVFNDNLKRNSTTQHVWQRVGM
jgi:hypothetical protein